MSRKIKLVGTFLIMALLMSLISVVPLFSATAGTIKIVGEAEGDRISWTNSSATIYIHVEDADLNTPIKLVEIPGETSPPVGVEEAEDVTALVEAGGSVYFALDKIPVLDSGVSTWTERVDGATDGFVNKKDVVLVYLIEASGETGVYADATGTADATILTASVDGLVLVNVPTGKKPSELGYDKVYAAYWGSDKNKTGQDDDALVTVKSSQDEDGIWLELVETTSTSGVFEAALELCAADTTCSVDNEKLWVAASDTVTATYTDKDPSRTVRTTVVVESTAPAFSNFSPEDGYATDNTRPPFAGSVTDADSGVLQDEDVALTIRFMFRLTDVDGNLLGYEDDDVDPEDIGNVAAITGGFTATLSRLPSTLVTTDEVYIIEWWMKALDVAGNVGISDLDTDTTCDPSAFLDITDPIAIHDCEPYTVRVDFEDPEMVSAKTGNWWDAATGTPKSGTEAKNTSIEVVFTEPLDGTSVQVGDFRSTAVSIQAAQWFSDRPQSVFLTTAAMKSDLKPTVEVVSAIRDKAGNAMTTGSVVADDGIPAALTVTVTGTAASQPATDKTITIEVKSDEALTSTPGVQIKAVKNNWAITGDNLAGAPSLIATRTWKVTKDLTAAGLYNVYVSGIDLGGLITATAGVASGSVEDDEDAILFEVDTGVADPAFTPADEGETDNPDTFIIVTFTNEGKEYGLTAGGVFTTTPADVVTSYDEHDTVTITAATLDGAAITFSTRDDVVFLARPGGLELGEHTIAIAVEDEAGNEADFEATFEVTERAAYELPVQPGMNLLSLPGSPLSTGINDVLGAVDAIDLVVTYAPADPAGPWLTAQRNATTGLLEGTLTTIDGQHAYWVRSDTFVDVEVYIAEVGYQELPPTIMVVKGWNLVPVTDVGLSDAGTAIFADDYLTSIGWTVGWSFDTLTDSWQRISYLGGDNVVVGMGYWVWATATGTIVP